MNSLLELSLSKIKSSFTEFDKGLNSVLLCIDSVLNSMYNTGKSTLVNTINFTRTVIDLSIIKPYKMSKYLMSSTYDIYGMSWSLFSRWSRGIITNRMIKEYILLQTRIYLTKKFMIGHLVKHRGINKLYFYDGCTLKCICFENSRGLRQIIRVETVDENNTNPRNVTEDVLMKIGTGNFYNIPTYPKLLGYESHMRVTYRGNFEVLYASCDIINLTYRKDDELVE